MKLFREVSGRSESTGCLLLVASIEGELCDLLRLAGLEFMDLEAARVAAMRDGDLS